MKKSLIGVCFESEFIYEMDDDFLTCIKAWRISLNDGNKRSGVKTADCRMWNVGSAVSVSNERTDESKCMRQAVQAHLCVEQMRYREIYSSKSVDKCDAFLLRSI